MGWLTFKTEAEANVPKPSSNHMSLFVDQGDGMPKFRDDDGNLVSLKGAEGDPGPKGDDGPVGDPGPAGADGHILNVSDLGSITGSITVDLSTGHVFTATLTGDVTFAWSGLPAAGTMTDRTLILTQDATGSQTITWPSGTKWPGGLAYTTDTANVETAVGLLVDSSGNTRAFPVEDFS